MIQGMTLSEMAATVEKNAYLAQDYVIPTTNMDFQVWNKEVRYGATIPNHKQIEGTMTDHAMRQICTELNIPNQYAQTLLEQDPQLLETNLNERSRIASGARMLRTIDSKLVGAVSPSFSRLYDNDIILRALLPSIADEGFVATLCFCNLPNQFDKCLSIQILGCTERWTV